LGDFSFIIDDDEVRTFKVLLFAFDLLLIITLVLIEIILLLILVIQIIFCERNICDASNVIFLEPGNDSVSEVVEPDLASRAADHQVISLNFQDINS
jgi:uncharacterized membrane protein